MVKYYKQKDKVLGSPPRAPFVLLALFLVKNNGGEEKLTISLQLLLREGHLSSRTLSIGGSLIIINNLFLTGERGVGKSTLLKRLLAYHSLRIGGFRTLPFACEEASSGYYLVGSAEPLPVNPSPDRIIALRTADGRMQQQFPEVFETLGVAILSRCAHNWPDLIIMDELGFIENEALRFQEWVFRCLDAPVLVLGVIKPLSTPFLDCIRGRKDVATFAVTLANREELLAQLQQQLILKEGGAFYEAQVHC